MKEYKQLGAYGIILKDEKILLINKVGGPYDGLLDLPGGTIEFNEKPSDTLIREMFEETGIKVLSYNLFDVDSINFEWNYKENVKIAVHHIGIFYKVSNYNFITDEIKIDEQNNDSAGIRWKNLNNINEKEVSKTAWLIIKKLKV